MIKLRVDLFLLFFLISITTGAFAQPSGSQVQVSFSFMANGRPIILTDSSYTNIFNEPYTVSRLKFYITDINLFSSAHTSPLKKKNIYLVDVSAPGNITLAQTAGKYDALEFTIGVDSAGNAAGAQDGALDPLNGMYWTWHSGYIFFKLEGTSPASGADLNRIEHHIGGYQGPNKAQTKVTIPLPSPLLLSSAMNSQLNIEVNLDKYWQSASAIKISELPLVMTPGETARKCAANLAHLFSISSMPQ